MPARFLSLICLAAGLAVLVSAVTEDSLVTTKARYDSEMLYRHDIVKRQADTLADGGLTDTTPPPEPLELYTDCGGNLTAPTGHFYTPYFPYTYPNNSDCVWTIEVPAPYTHIKIDFLPRVHLEPGVRVSTSNTSSVVVCFDAVTIHDGPNSEHKAIRTSCGLDLMQTQYSSSNTLTVRFTSDDSVSRPGFMGIYAGLKADNTTDCVDPFTHGHSLSGELL